MRDVLDDLMSIWRTGSTAGVATVVRTFKSAPRGPGATMMVAPDGTVSGSVSGGCVEGATYELANEVMATGVPRLQRYGVSDDDAFAIGLTCGGIIDVFVEPVSLATFPELGAVADDIAAQRPVSIATVIAHPDEARVGRRLTIGPEAVVGSLGSSRADCAVTDDARGLLVAGRSEVLGYGPDGQRRGEGMDVFVSVHAPRPRMLVFGAIDFAAAVAAQGSFLGYRVTVCDARPVFATAARMPTADDVVVDWPHRYLAAQARAGAIDARTVICVLTHDPKFDVPLLEVALRLPELAYLGAMGSRRTHDDRMNRLRQAGLTEAELSRLASPIGLDLGARTPEETAVSIAAEIIARRWGGSGLPLAGTVGRIHHDQPSAASATGILLAAGAGTRYGMPKVLAEQGDWLRAGVAALQSGGCDDVVVVLGAAIVDVPVPARAVIAADWTSGLNASVRAGLAAVGTADHAVLHTVDTPDVGADVVRRVLTAAQASTSGLARAHYRGRPGHPVALARRHWPGLLGQLRGDEGARQFLQSRSDVLAVECADLATGQDIDEQNHACRVDT